MSKIITNEIAYSDVSNVHDIDPDTLVTAFRLLPRDTADSVHKQFFGDIFSMFLKKLFDDNHRSNRDDSFDYSTRHNFLEEACLCLVVFQA